jgi:hypothetical protein
VTEEYAHKLFGHRFIGNNQLKAISSHLPVAPVPVGRLPWSDDVLEAHASTHILLHCPGTFVDGTPITINSMRNRFGTRSSAHEPCFYNQDWYVKESFASSPLAECWHLIRVSVLEEARAQLPEKIESSLAPREAFPAAVTCAFAFFAYWFHTGNNILWRNDFIWCRDRDHQGDRIYVGRYEDPAGFSNNGFNIHRHLALRSVHSAAPEIARDDETKNGT